MFEMYSVADLETFVAVARYGGITSGAGHLGISAATTSHRIAKLEARLGVKLFHRNSRSFTLSDEGLLYLERVEPLLAELQQAETDVGGGDGGVRGHLRATMSPWILSRFVMPYLAGFRACHPGLTVEFLAVDRFVSLVEEGQDCAIRVGTLPDSALIARKLAENHRILCAAPRFIAAHGLPETVETLQQLPWVCLPWQMQFEVAPGGGTPRRLTVSRHVTVSNSDMLTDAAVQGLGLAVKSRLAIARELDDGTLVEVMPGTLAAPEAPIWFVSPQGSRTGRKTAEFAKLVSKAFRGPPENTEDERC